MVVGRFPIAESVFAEVFAAARIQVFLGNLFVDGSRLVSLMVLVKFLFEEQ